MGSNIEVNQKCYRNGGCGPYEMYSCSECPASKPEYAIRVFEGIIDKSLNEIEKQRLVDFIKSI